jgi:hypothetical protein
VVSGAITTNKATISSIQTFMQGNLDLGVTSVGLAMPSAFTVTGSPVTASGNISVTGAGTVSQYIRGDGSLADFPQGGGGGGASVSYYLNGSVSQGTIGGIAYLEMNKTPILGAGTDFTINANGYIASFITDAGDPGLLQIPAGNWNFETYFQASSGGGSPTFYVELYKVNSGGTATLIASSSANPELIAFGTNTTPYFSALAVPTTVLTITDRLAIRYYVTHSGRTITLHTENGNLCQIITTFTTGLTALNGLTAQVQNFATGTSGTDFGIVSAGTTHTFNIPDASATARGLVTTGGQTFAGTKSFSSDAFINGVHVGKGLGSVATNTMVGTAALSFNTTGSSNTSAGFQSLQFNTTGSQNTSVGVNSLQNNTTGSFNTSIGSETLNKNTTGFNNTAVGRVALRDNTTGTNNTAYGNLALYLNTTGSQNTGIGFSALGGITTGINNVGIGHVAGNLINSGTENITSSNSVYLGHDTRASASGNTNEIVIGHEGRGNGSNTVTIGNSSITNNYFTGNVNGGAFVKTGGTSSQFLMADGSVNTSVLASGAYLPLAGGTMTGAILGTTSTFTNAGSGIGVGVTNSGSGDGIKITHSAGRAFQILSSGAGYGVIINNETASTSAPFTIQKQGLNKVAFTDAGAADFSSSVTASSFVKTSGTSSQFLKADGSVDSSTYLTTGSAASTYLPLAGGTLTGPLNGTSASFTGDITLSAGGTNKGIQYTNTYGSTVVTNALNDNSYITGALRGEALLLSATASKGLRIGNTADNISYLSFASTGAATFSSSVNVGGTSSNTDFRVYRTVSLGTFFSISAPGGSPSTSTLGVSGTDVMTLNVSGNVGIGTASPAERLHVETSNEYQITYARTSIGKRWALGVDTSGTYFSNRTDSVLPLYITNTGNVGIGTTSPDTFSYGGNRNFLTLRSSATNQEPFLQLIANGVGNSIIDFGNGSIRRATIIGENGSNLAFFTNGTNSGTGVTERMCLQSNGVLKIGNGQTVDDGINPGYKNVAIAYNDSGNFGEIQAIQQNINVFTLRLNNSGGQVYAGASRLDNISDERMKTDIEPITNALEKIKQLSGKKFHLIDEEEGKIRYGFIAQDLEGILDDFVVNTNMTYKNEEKEIQIENVKSIESWASSWAALLVEAIKEQQEQINSLKNQIK